MEWLLKITDGPMKGAEIALVAGTRVTLGKGEGCDIVVADASLADEAFALDVAETGVTLVRGDGTGVAMRPFETRAFGTTAVAVGPAEGAWEELRPAVEEEESKSKVEGEGKVEVEGEGKVEVEGEGKVEVEGEGKGEGEEGRGVENPVAGKGGKKRVVFGLFAILLLAAGLVALWFLRTPLKAKSSTEKKTAAVSASASANLAALAKEHGLVFSNANGVATLAGNVARRTERHAIRALALAADRHCRLDLSDDESFKSAADALLFTVTEGAVKVAKAAARQVDLTGYAPDELALSRVLEAVRADVPWVEKVTTQEIEIGGEVPEELRGNRFAMTGQLATAGVSPALASPSAAAQFAATNAPSLGTNAVAAARAREQARLEESQAKAAAMANLPADERQAAQLAQIAEARAGLLPRDVLPVAGILTKPYPCVVLSDGHRLIEGAKISGLEIKAIEAAKITFVYRDKTVRWEP